MDLVALIADIHGNSHALRAVLEDIAGRGVERIYCLGDLVGYGADPNGVIDLLQERRIPALLGNYDDGVGRDAGDCGCYYATAEARRLGAASYAFTAATVTAERKAYLRGLPGDRHVHVGGGAVHLVHGSPRRINEYLLHDRDEKTFLRIAAAESDECLAFGHTHQQWSRQIGGVLFVAAGSVGRPKDGDPRAMYTLLRAVGDEGRRLEAEPLRVPYDVRSAAAAVVAAGLPGELAEGLLRGT